MSRWGSLEVKYFYLTHIFRHSIWHLGFAQHFTEVICLSFLPTYHLSFYSQTPVFACRFLDSCEVGLVKPPVSEKPPGKPHLQYVYKVFRKKKADAQQQQFFGKHVTHARWELYPADVNAIRLPYYFLGGGNFDLCEIRRCKHACSSQSERDASHTNPPSPRVNMGKHQNITCKLQQNS